MPKPALISKRLTIRMVSLNRSPNGAYTLAVSMRVTRNHGESGMAYRAASTGAP